MRRREFMALVGGAAAWPCAARAQSNGQLRRVALLLAEGESDPDATLRNETFRAALARRGWTEGDNVRIDTRWNVAAADRIHAVAAELATQAPDVIVPSGAGMVAALLQAMHDVPIVFVLVADPVGAGFVDSLAHPGGNATGFTSIDYIFGGKWLELLKQLVPSLTRIAIIRDPTVSAGIGLFGSIQSAASSLGVEVSPVNVRDESEIARGIAAFARGANDGLVVTPSTLVFAHRDLIVSLAAQHKLPAVYPGRPFVAAGGLATYAPSVVKEYEQAAGYVDRVLKGEKPDRLPVQNPTKYDLILNLKTAKALGITVPHNLLVLADEVIE
jgi:putative tryptophan/tyrosine transport system substrate-binding protein